MIRQDESPGPLADRYLPRGPVNEEEVIGMQGIDVRVYGSLQQAVKEGLVLSPFLLRYPFLI